MRVFDIRTLSESQKKFKSRYHQDIASYDIFDMNNIHDWVLMKARDIFRKRDCCIKIGIEVLQSVTPFCKTLDGNAKLAAAPAIFCLNDRQMHAKGKIVI